MTDIVLKDLDRACSIARQRLAEGQGWPMPQTLAHLRTGLPSRVGGPALRLNEREENVQSAMRWKASPTRSAGDGRRGRDRRGSAP